MAEQSNQIVLCERCRARCRASESGNPKAKMLRRSNVPKGLCVNCATHDWLRNTYPCNMILDDSGPTILLHPTVREQFAEIMRGAMADAKPGEINWNLIVENWELPFAKKAKLSPTNPYRPGKDRPFGEGVQYVTRDKSGLSSRGNLIIRSFDELNEIEPGLGDSFRKCLRGQHETVEHEPTADTEPATEPPVEIKHDDWSTFKQSEPRDQKSLSITPCKGTLEMSSKKHSEILHCPVTFGTVADTGTVSRVTMKFDRANITLEQADALLCERRLTGRLIVLPDGIDPDQKSFPGLDEKHELCGVFDTRGFSVRKRKIGGGATFAGDTIDAGELHHFANRSGRLIVTESAEIPETEKEKPKPSSVPEVGGEWRKTRIDQIGLNPSDARKLADADILTTGDLQNRMIEYGSWWNQGVKGIGNVAKERVGDVFNRFVTENDGDGEESPEEAEAEV